jgi:hypothetical protein
VLLERAIFGGTVGAIRQVSDSATAIWFTCLATHQFEEQLGRDTAVAIAAPLGHLVMQLFGPG